MGGVTAFRRSLQGGCWQGQLVEPWSQGRDWTLGEWGATGAPEQPLTAGLGARAHETDGGVHLGVAPVTEASRGQRGH